MNNPTVIAVASDNKATEYVYFESAPGAYIRGNVPPNYSVNLTDYLSQGYGLAPANSQAGGQATAIKFLNGDPLFIYQDTAGLLRAYDVSRQTAEVFNTTLSAAAPAS